MPAPIGTKSPTADDYLWIGTSGGSWGAANRNPLRWERPGDYDIRRAAAGHVGWGVGIHACVNMLLARLEGECALTALARQVGAIELAGPRCAAATISCAA